MAYFSLQSEQVADNDSLNGYSTSSTNPRWSFAYPVSLNTDHKDIDQYCQLLLCRLIEIISNYLKVQFERETGQQRHIWRSAKDMHCGQEY